MANVIVRPAGPDDIESAMVVYLESNLARRGGDPTPPSHVDRVRVSMHRDDTIRLIAEDACDCVGMALAMQSLANYGLGDPEPGICFLSMIFVAPDRWSEGIGGKLVDRVVAEAEVRGYERIQLWTHATNVRAQRLYERLGFSRSGVEHHNDLGELVVQYQRILRPA